MQFQIFHTSCWCIFRVRTQVWMQAISKKWKKFSIIFLIFSAELHISLSHFLDVPRIQFASLKRLLLFFMQYRSKFQTILSFSLNASYGTLMQCCALYCVAVLFSSFLLNLNIFHSNAPDATAKRFRYCAPITAQEVSERLHARFGRNGIITLQIEVLHWLNYRRSKSHTTK